MCSPPVQIVVNHQTRDIHPKGVLRTAVPSQVQFMRNSWHLPLGIIEDGVQRLQADHRGVNAYSHVLVCGRTSTASSDLCDVDCHQAVAPVQRC